jgi:hypothetical protein
LKSWLIIIWVWPILFCSTEAPANNWWAKGVIAKNGRSKLQGRCELSGGQRLASFVYLVYCLSALDLAKNFSLSWLQVPANYTQPLANGCQMSS